MKYICLLLTFALLTFSCKKEDQSTAMIVTTENPYFTGSSTTFRGSIFSHPNKVNVTEHGFRIMETGPYPPYLDTTINLGPRKEIGYFESTLNNLDPGVEYQYHAYVIDNNNRMFSSRKTSVYTMVNSLSVTTETPYITPESTTLKGVISSSFSPTINAIDHGFRVMDAINPAYMDTTISLGGRNSTGSFQSELFYLAPGTGYKYYAYVVDNNNITYTSAEDLFNTVGGAP